MNVALTKPWTIERFLDWAGRQEGRYEFDGFQPVAMTGGTGRHCVISQNICFALRTRMRGTSCSVFGPNLGVQTIGNAVRYPDALVTCTKFDLSDRLAPDVKIVFEVLSPSSGTLDRVTKLREYGGVPSILRYVIVEYESVGLQVMHRQKGGEEWRVLPLTEGQVLPLPEIGAEIPLSEIYEDVTFPEAPAL